MANYSTLKSSGEVAVYANMNALIAATGMSDGDQAFVTATNNLYIYSTSGWYKIATVQNDSPSAITGVQGDYGLAMDGTATTITAVSTDPDGFPLTWSYSTSGLGSIATVSQADNVFTITPSTDSANIGTFTLTINATDGVNGAVSTNTSITLVFSIENSQYTTLLATAVDTSDNNNLTDSSTNNHSITAYGNTHAGTFSPYRRGGYSVEFDGTDDFLTITDSSLELSGEFTVSFWLYLNSLKDYNTPFHWSDFSGNGSGYDNDIYISSSGQINSRLRTTAAQGSSNTISAGQWYYLTVTRNSSNVIKVWVDESEEISYTGSGTLDNYIAIGYNPYSGGRNYLDGYIRDFKITDASVSSPTIPSEPVASDSNTKLLTCHLPYFADGSTNDHAITPNGGVSIQPFAPYDYAAYSATNHGGSVYFDGTGDYLSVSSTSDFGFGTSTDFTLEAWIYPTTGTGDRGLFDFRTTVNEDAAFFIDASTGRLAIWNGVLYGATGTVVSANQWHHVAFVRSGSTTTAYLDGGVDFTTTASLDFGTTKPLNIGGTALGAGSYFTGYFADYRIIRGTAVYTSEFTLPTAPLTAITNTSILLNMQNASIIDKSQTSNLNLVGNTTGSTTQVKFSGSRSMYFDGTGDYVTAPSPDLSESYTIEFWFYMTSWSDADGFFGWQTNAKFGVGGYGSTLKYWRRANPYGFGMQNFTYDILNQTEIEALVGSWNHFALVANADSTNTKIFINGTLKTDISLFDSHTSSENIQIGAFDFESSHSSSPKYFHGHMQDFRVTKGLARYTANFTPPTDTLQG